MLPQMTTIQVNFPDEDPVTLPSLAKRTGRRVEDLVREAVRRVWLGPEARSPIALWDRTPTKTSLEHDATYDET